MQEKVIPKLRAMFGLFMCGICAYVAGAVSIIVATWWWLTTQKALTDKPESASPGVSQAQLPEELLKKIKKGEEGYQRRETCVALNLLLQFFFQEMQYENNIIRWLTNKLNLEFNELLKHRALSKIIGSMKVRDLQLGSNFPIIKAVTPQHVELDSSTSTLNMVDVAVEMEYNGGIQLTVDAESRFAKSTMVTIKVINLSGKARLQFSRYPFTHWSFSFYEEPEANFEVKSNLLGRHIPRFSNIIVSRLRSMLKRKHTLPYFKLRAAPLIKRDQSALPEEGGSVPPGRLTAQIIKCSRLQKCLVGEFLYCTVILSEVPLVCGVETTAGLWVIQDLLIKRSKGAPIGILLRNTQEKEQVVETVAVGSSAYIAGVRKGDILQSVNNTILTSGAKAAKLFSANASTTEEDHPTISARIKRFIPHADSLKTTVASSKGIEVDSVCGSVDEGDTGEGSLSRGSTPDSSHNNSPELKRKHFNIKSLHYETPTLSSSTNNTSSNLPENTPDNAKDGQSSTAGTPTSSEMLNQRETPFSPSHKAEERHSSSSKRRNKQLSLKLGHTGIVAGTTDPIFGSNFEFWLNDENKYLHVAVWSQKSKLPDECNERNVSNEEITSKENEKTKKRSKVSDLKDKLLDDDKRNESKDTTYLTKSITEDTFLGYTNLSLISLIPETTLNTQGHIVKVLSLTPPDPTCPEVGSHPWLTHKGFDPKFCYGDITLSLVYQPHDRVEGSGTEKLKSNVTLGSDDETSQTDGTASEEDNENSSDKQNQRSHTFKKTYFHSSTYCDFCKKKIWLKFAYQCSECSIICHKKCMAKCNNETLCDMGGICFKDGGGTSNALGASSSEAKTVSPPEIVTHMVTSGASDDEDNTHEQNITASPQRRTLGSLLAQVASAGKGSLKRAGSANNLSLPSQLLEASLSRSLPHTPQHTPQPSRRASLSEANPFEMDYDEEVGEAILDRLVLYQHDERLLALARDSAKDLYKHLQPEQRREKISSFLEQLKVNVDREGEIRVDLAHQEKKATDAGDDLAKTKVSLEISQCDARTQALALLNLHYCTALQFCDDSPQEPQKELSENEGSL